MSHRKNWKQFNYIKNDQQQQRDSQSEISESRSSRSYHFNKVKFNKSRDNLDTSTKKFGLANVAKIKDSSRQNSLINDSMMKRVDTSFTQKLEKSSHPSNLKLPKNKKIQIQMQRFLSDMRKVHDGFKILADNILLGFEKIKDELQTNLLKVIDQLLRTGNNLRHQQKIHDVIHKSFQQMKKNISILPCSFLTQLNNSKTEEVLQKRRLGSRAPSSALIIKPDEMRNSRQQVHPIHSPKQVSGDFNFQLPISSSQKVRPNTERKIHTRLSSFNQNLPPKQYLGSPTPNRTQSDFFSMEKPNNLDNIIAQMKSILNQST